MTLPSTTHETVEPRIIPRAGHCISRRNIDREALKVLYRLRDEGFAAYLVGGGVRDLLLEKTPKDYDISTDARPGQLRTIFPNSRIIGKRFRLVQIFFRGNKIVEVSTFRCHGEYENGENSDTLLADNNTFGTPAEDAFRRDLTINALFYTVTDFSIIDYVGGVEDLQNRIIRFVGEPDRRVARDPVRIMRAIRHAARTGFTIEEQSWRAICEHHEKLALCPVSRLRDELFKDLTGGASRSWFLLAEQSGVFQVLLPFYAALLADADDGDNVRAELAALCGVVDRLRCRGRRIADHLILSLLLYPWARRERQRQEAQQASEEDSAPRLPFIERLRVLLDENLERLNIKRADKAAMAILLSNYQSFERYSGAKWPKRLSMKSYFRECLQFFELVREASGGEPVADIAHAPTPAPDLNLAPEPEPGIEPEPEPVLAPRSSRSRGGRRGRSHGAPVYAGKDGRGIFGLKRRQG